MNKVIVGISGGVDSSVTALKLQQQGLAVEALFMKNWDEDDGTEYCTARTDLEDALRVCGRYCLLTAYGGTEYIHTPGITGGVLGFILISFVYELQIVKHCIFRRLG